MKGVWFTIQEGGKWYLATGGWREIGERITNGAKIAAIRVNNIIFDFRLLELGLWPIRSYRE